jgi:hypothetical protein
LILKSEEIEVHMDRSVQEVRGQIKRGPFPFGNLRG